MEKNLKPTKTKKTVVRKNERNWAMSCHLLTFLGFIIPFGNIIGPMVVWLSMRSRSSFIDEHGKGALNFQISIILYAFCGIILFVGSLLSFLFLVAGIFLFIALGIVELVFVLIAAIRAQEGKPYRYPLTIRFIK